MATADYVIAVQAPPVVFSRRACRKMPRVKSRFSKPEERMTVRKSFFQTSGHCCGTRPKAGARQPRSKPASTCAACGARAAKCLAEQARSTQ